MKKTIFIALSAIILIACQTAEPNNIPTGKNGKHPQAKIKRGIQEPATYLDSVKSELLKTWPNNRTINLVFHGHSVPSGYYNTPYVNTLESYPHLLLKKLKNIYPNAVINVITTSVGGENAVKGAQRFDKEVLVHRADVLFIDYSLNDRNVGLKNARIAWEEMIEKALAGNLKVILMCPSPDAKVDIFDLQTDLAKHRAQVIQLAEKYGTGLVDSYKIFGEAVKNGSDINTLMSHRYHPNEKGHELIADGILKYFK